MFLHKVRGAEQVIDLVVMNAVDGYLFSDDLFDHDWGRFGREHSTDENNASSGANQSDGFEGPGVGT